MTDMKSVIKPKSDQLNADDLISGALTIKVTDVNITSTEQPVSIRFEGDNGKPYKPCKSMCRILVMAWGADAKQYIGKSMTLYRDPDVTWAGMKVGGIRISHLSDIASTLTVALTATRSSKKPYTVQPLKAEKKPAPVAQESEPDEESLLIAATREAHKGMAALEAYWKSKLSQKERDVLQPYLDNLKETAGDVDKNRPAGF